MNRFYVFRALESRSWWSALSRLERALDAGSAAEVESSYVDLIAGLIDERRDSLASAVAAVLLDGDDALALPDAPQGLAAAARHDLSLVQRAVTTDWRARAQAALGSELPPLECLAPADPELSEWAGRLRGNDAGVVLEALLSRYRSHGVGLLARHLAFRWSGGALTGIETPAQDRLEELIGLDTQLERLVANVERFVRGAPSLHTLLYGSRGSGKSTAVRSLLPRYARLGLRLVETAPEALADLPALAERLRRSPRRFVVFVDDLAFEAGDVGYRPLKSLLEGSLTERPENVLIIATSNRRHLVRESLADRPLPEDDDVHAWDTTNEKLALADRFGLVITFPGTDQRRYLEVVRRLAESRGVALEGAELERAAVRFADWGNGYSGRTARQFVDTLV